MLFYQSFNKTSNAIFICSIHSNFESIYIIADILWRKWNLVSYKFSCRIFN